MFSAKLLAVWLGGKGAVKRAKGENLIPEFKQVCLLDLLNDAEVTFAASWTLLKRSAGPTSLEAS
jgi:hypothetical protein